MAVFTKDYDYDYSKESWKSVLILNPVITIDCLAFVKEFHNASSVIQKLF